MTTLCKLIRVNVNLNLFIFFFSFSFFPALFFSPKSSRHSTSFFQQQATGRHECLDRRAEGRLLQNLPPRSKNIWWQTSEFESGKLIQYSLIIWKLQELNGSKINYAILIKVIENTWSHFCCGKDVITSKAIKHTMKCWNKKHIYFRFAVFWKALGTCPCPRFIVPSLKTMVDLLVHFY